MTIYGAWQKAYQDLKAFFDNDTVALYQYIDTDNYPQITVDHRPVDCYANVFGGLWTFCDATPQSAAMGKICDELDAQMFTMFETWAEEDLRKQFETEFKQHGQYDAPDMNTFKLDEDGKWYDDVVVHTAYLMWRQAKGI